MKRYSFVATRHYSAFVLALVGCGGSPGETSGAEARNGSEALATTVVGSSSVDPHASDSRGSDVSSTGVGFKGGDTGGQGVVEISTAPVAHTGGTATEADSDDA